MYVCVCTMCVKVTSEAKDSIGLPEAKVTNACEPWELGAGNQTHGPWDEHRASTLSTMKPSSFIYSVTIYNMVESIFKMVIMLKSVF